MKTLLASAAFLPVLTGSALTGRAAENAQTHFYEFLAELGQIEPTP